jgi:hypothetical protein
MQSVNIGPVSVSFFRGEDGNTPAEIQPVSAYRDKFPAETEADAYFVAVEDGDQVVMKVSTTESVELTANEDSRSATPGTPDSIAINETCTTVTVKKADGTTTTAKFYLVVSSSLEEDSVLLVDDFDGDFVCLAEEEENEESAGFFSELADSVGGFFGSIFGGGKEEPEPQPEPQQQDQDQPVGAEPLTVGADVGAKSEYVADTYQPPFDTPDPTPAPAPAPDPTPSYTPDPTPSYTPDPTPSYDSSSSSYDSSSSSYDSSSSSDCGSSDCGGGDGGGGGSD